MTKVINKQSTEPSRAHARGLYTVKYTVGVYK